MKTQQVYQVITEGDEEGRTIRTIGYAIGSPEDIKNFYDDKKSYSLTLAPIKVVHVTPDSVLEKKALSAEREKLYARLKTLDALI